MPMTPSSSQSHGPSPQCASMQRASLRYTVSGRRGPPGLLLHEMGGSLESWDPMLQWRPAEQRVLRCDMRGAGGSEKIRAETTCTELADDVAALLDHLGATDPVDVAGCAIGGCL